MSFADVSSSDLYAAEMHCCIDLLLDRKHSSGVSLVWASMREIQGKGLFGEEKKRSRIRTKLTMTEINLFLCYIVALTPL